VNVPNILRIVQALLQLICEKEKLDPVKTDSYLRFVHKHVRDPSMSSTRFPARPPKAAFDDAWWTLGRDRADYHEHMGMISIAVCTLGGFQGLTF
jgi:hypothetical protein